MKLLLRVALFTLVAGGTLASFASTSCGPKPDKDRVTEIIQPDFAIYKDNVDPYLARRCGTLDCHGQAGRGYRLYSREGFRDYTLADGSLVSGQQQTTDEERRANFYALIGVEPEQLNRVMATQGSDEELNRWIWLRKALKAERHKGGKAMAPDDPGYKCVVAWLRVPVVRPGPDGEPQDVPPKERVFDPKFKDLCALATSYP